MKRHLRQGTTIQNLRETVEELHAQCCLLYSTLNEDEKEEIGWRPSRYK